MNYAEANILHSPIHGNFTTPDKILLHVILKICHFLFPTLLIPAKKKKKKKVMWTFADIDNTWFSNKISFLPFVGAVQSSIGCLCQITRVAAAIVAPSSTSSPSAVTTTSGRGRPAALSNHWLPRHSPTRPTGPSAWVVQWGRPCQLRG